MNKKKTCAVLIVILIIAMVLLGSFFYCERQEKKLIEKKLVMERKEKELVNSINNHYNKYVNVSKDSYLYKFDNKSYKVVGTIYKDKKIELDDIKITKNTKYFKIKNTDFYIKYKNVSKCDEFVIDDRYKNYVVFNENIVTSDEVLLYQNDKVVMKLNFSLDVPIIIKDVNRYGIEYDGQLYFINSDCVKNVYSKVNSDSLIADSVAVTVYHFIYLNGDTSCNEIICHSENQITEEFDYLKNEGYFTINTKEMLYFIEKKINLPKKSILITIDDGARAQNFIPILEKYKFNATLFLVSSWYNKDEFSSQYLEIASHTHNLHTPGMCLGGQGSPLKCLDRSVLLDDLAKSRNYLNTDAFCFPFYEFNEYAINIIKEAGFKMAFIGGMKKASIGIDPYKIPRITISNSTTIDEYKNYIN